MSEPRYLPATRTVAHSLSLGPVSIRTADDRELGRLLGFVIDGQDHHIQGLVMEVPSIGESLQLELPMVSLRFDADTRSLRLTSSDVPSMRTFLPGSLSHVDEADLWVPLVSTAA